MKITSEQYMSQEVRIRLLQENMKTIHHRFDKLSSLILRGITGIIVTIIIPVGLHAFGWM